MCYIYIYIWLINKNKNINKFSKNQPWEPSAKTMSIDPMRSCMVTEIGPGESYSLIPALFITLNRQAIFTLAIADILETIELLFM